MSVVRHDLQKLTITKEQLASRTLQSFIDEYIETITELDTSDCNIGPKEAIAISGMKNVTSLNVRWNHIGQEGAEAISSMTNITSLNIRGNNIGPKGARAISGMKKVTSLNVRWNYIGTEGAEAISTMKKLTSLDISWNNIGSEGAKIISTMRNVTSLNVAENGIEMLGAMAISRMKNLTNLNIRWNNISSEGAKMIVESLPHLTSLELDFKNFGIKQYEQYSGTDIEIYQQIQKNLSVETRNYWKAFHMIPQLQHEQECIQKCSNVISEQNNTSITLANSFSLVVLQEIITRQLQVNLVECKRIVDVL